MIRWLLTSVALLGLAATLAIRGRTANFTGFEPALITINITVAVLAINFSFVAYQSSEYRQFQRGLSPNLLFGCLWVLLFAMAPAIALVFSHSLVGIVGVTELPITTLLSLGLVALAKHEATPNALIKQLTSKQKWRRAFRQHTRSVNTNKEKWKQFELSKPVDMPTHEWRWAPLPSNHDNDPFSILGSIGRTAVKAGNIASVVRVTEALLSALDICYAEHYSKKKEKDFSSEASTVIHSQLQRLSLAAEDVDPTGDVSSRFLDACAEYLGQKAGESWPFAEPCFFVSSIMVESGKRWLAKGETGTSKTPLIVIRLVCQKGVDEWGKLPNKEDLADTIDALFFPHNIATMARFIQNLGSAAIESKETDFLYRVFEAFGWLGCSALKAGNHEVTCVCVRGLAQLGREARVKKLECHWDQCAVKPEDHARERIEWIATWISKVEKDQQEPWIGIVSQGFSRLAGKIVEVKMPETNGDTIMRLNITEEDHVEGFSSNAGGRDLDYSDFSMLKDFGLHGFMGGTLMQGPVIPFVTSPTESPP